MVQAEGGFALGETDERLLGRVETGGSGRLPTGRFPSEPGPRWGCGGGGSGLGVRDARSGRRRFFVLLCPLPALAVCGAKAHNSENKQRESAGDERGGHPVHAALSAGGGFPNPVDQMKGRLGAPLD